MFLRNMLLERFNLEYLIVLRNCFIIKDPYVYKEVHQKYDIDISLIDSIYFDEFFDNVNTNKSINKFFLSFLKAEIYDRNLDEKFALFYKCIFYELFHGLNDTVYRRRFLFSVNHGFSGLFEMLFLNSTIVLPKRFSFFSTNNFLKDDNVKLF
jgi:hypothetical protein